MKECSDTQNLKKLLYNFPLFSLNILFIDVITYRQSVVLDFFVITSLGTLIAMLLWSHQHKMFVQR